MTSPDEIDIVQNMKTVARFAQPPEAYLFQTLLAAEEVEAEIIGGQILPLREGCPPRRPGRPVARYRPDGVTAAGLTQRTAFSTTFRQWAWR